MENITHTPSWLYPSRRLVLALVAYVALAFAGTVAAGDLGDIGFWIVWIPVVLVVVYVPIVGVARLVRRS